MKKQNGITLVSLVITIIIMLILAGVALSMVIGEGSVLDQTNAAAAQTKVAEIQEYIDLAVANNKVAKYSKTGLKSKETLATEMFNQGLITEEEKNKILADEELKINDVVINYADIETTYNDAVNNGVVENNATIITFTIDSNSSPHVPIEYQATEGMTWEEWVNSEYNTDGFSLDTERGTVKYYHEDPTVHWPVYYEGLSGVVDYTESIVAGHDYAGIWD